jgi:hypothetical protein
MVKRSEAFDSESAPTSQAKPTAVMSRPKRFSGRLAQATTPLPMKAQTATRLAVATNQGFASWLLVNVR